MPLSITQAVSLIFVVPLFLPLMQTCFAVVTATALQNGDLSYSIATIPCLSKRRAERGVSQTATGFCDTASH